MTKREDSKKLMLPAKGDGDWCTCPERFVLSLKMLKILSSKANSNTRGVESNAISGCNFAFQGTGRKNYTLLPTPFDEELYKSDRPTIFSVKRRR
ncbi:hypothetical protein MKW98_007805 [Papaver atlanticum]|uniref:Uncharacterized protein n=1 Tax=Papaver atlanticum TaxID=357466 RepID=A0AAD4X4G1_9MAGN|nr:hypothetical protein MKW98_007805 [Papaver atlanticum]